jgi:phage terminase large subunit-like protein
LYGEILGDDYTDEDSIARRHRGYLVTKRSCFNADGSPIFPERFTAERLERERLEMGTFNFSAQYLNKPVPSDSQHFPWPIIERSFVDRKDLPKGRVYFTTFDLAISQSSDADHTAIVTCSIGTKDFEKSPHIYVEDLAVGHFKPLEVVYKLFEIYKRFHPVQVRTEEVGFQRLLEPIIRAESAARKMHLPMVWIPRDSREAKTARIAGLQPWFERGELHIVKDLPHKEQLVLELVRFPKYRRDDIVDALSDHMVLTRMFQASNEEPLAELTDRVGDPRLGLMA